MINFTMTDNKPVIKRTVIKLQREFGTVFPIEEILNENPDVSKEEVIMALDELEEEGLVTMLDKDSLQVNV